MRVRPVQPDVAIVHVQRSDAWGRAHAWGPLGITEEAGLAVRLALPFVDVLIGNQPELMLVAGETSLERATEKLRRRGVPVPPSMPQAARPPCRVRR